MSEPSLATLRTALAGFAAGQTSATQLAQLCRAQSAMTARLPAAFGQVLEDIATRLESGALFSEESCSFSQSDLVDELGVWVEKAQQRLMAKASA